PTRLAPVCFTPDGTRLVCLGQDSEALCTFDLRLIRRQLADLRLDWDAPAYPPAPAGEAPRELPAVEFFGVGLATDPAKMRRHELERITLRLWLNPLDAG